jgi:hypothetical protein
MLTSNKFTTGLSRAVVSLFHTLAMLALMECDLVILFNHCTTSLIFHSFFVVVVLVFELSVSQLLGKLYLLSHFPRPSFGGVGEAFLRKRLANYLPGLASNHDPLYCCLLSS